MSGQASGAEAYLYVISCWRLGLAKIGVAGDARKRLRELQVGSPLELRLSLTRPYADRREADAVAQELYRYFAGRRVRGSWYRLTALEVVRLGLGRRAVLEAPARSLADAEAAERERRVAPRRGEQLRARTEKQLAYERRRRQERAAKLKRVAKLLAQGMTQQQAAAELGVTTRTLRNWKAAPPSAASANSGTTTLPARERRRQPAGSSRPPATT